MPITIKYVLEITDILGQYELPVDALRKKLEQDTTSNFKFNLYKVEG
ncbi:unnamed protein product [marine sediment metagenome]|uniref:Uncharacterized protein n=1 Tax=marine sediment metagenome TaxID=412755 RepID=X1FW30_9ZZZZ